MKKRKFLKRTGWLILIVFILMNIVAFFHAYKFTHFSNTTKPKSRAEKMSFGEKALALFTGIDNPRPQNSTKPAHAFETITLESNKKIECWLIKADSSKGTVILFHGYGGEKSSLIDKSEIFLRQGYTTLLVDFMGSGGSEGNQTTIGYKEAEEVKTCYDYLVQRGEKKIFLFGTSLGAAAILKAMNDDTLKPAGIMIECPFGSLYKTTCARFKMMGVPSFPMAGLLVFWGGVQNGFWGFNYSPADYASKVNCPTLLLYGEKDERVSRGEIDQIYAGLKGQKRLHTFPLAGHENFLLKYHDEWEKEITTFLTQTPENASE